MQHDFDVIVIGSGASGGTLAADLATAGARVLVLERGQPSAELRHDEHATLMEKKPYDSREILINNRSARLYMGGIPGGGTAVYGAALLRPSQQDFLPGRHYADRIPRAIHDWPIDYATLQPFYDKAEALYRVAANPGDQLSPLAQPLCCADRPPLPLAAINQHLMDRSRASGLNPFQLPLAIQSSECLRCANCAGFVCPTGARRSSASLLQQLPVNSGNVTLLPHREVVQLERRNGHIASIQVLNLMTQAVEHFSASCYVLSAGAIGSPTILQRSGFEHPQLGRNYMLHYSPLVVGFFGQRTGADRTFVKQVGFADYYFGTSDLREKMGIVQSLPAPGPLMLKKSGLKWVPTFVLNQLRAHMLPFVGIVEDLPQASNRVYINNDGRISVQHRFSRYDTERGAALSRAMVRMLKNAGAAHCVSQQIPSAEHVAHQCGTVRFGKDAATAVVDQDCRMFGQDNLFVIDGSILPTSLGVGPALTLMANALRISQVIQRDLGKGNVPCLANAMPSEPRVDQLPVH